MEAVENNAGTGTSWAAGNTRSGGIVGQAEEEAKSEWTFVADDCTSEPVEAAVDEVRWTRRSFLFAEENGR